MKKLWLFLIGIVVGFLIFINTAGYRISFKPVPFTNKAYLVVTNSKGLYLKMYGPYWNPGSLVKR